MSKLYGTGVALVTPFDKEDNIDYQSYKRLLSYTAKQGVDYYVVLGTTGEGSTISLADKAKILDFTKENNEDNLPIVYGIGVNDTNATLRITKETDLTGVDAILSVSPYYSKPSQEGIFQHYTKIADSSPVPVILYNVPGRTGSNMSAETILRLAEHDNIIGVKDASGNIEQALTICKYKPEDFMLISGDDMLTVPLYSIGASGVISVLANAFANIFHNIKEAAAQGDFQKASTEAFKLLEINPHMYSESSPVGIKQLLAELGICENHVRLPLVPASQSLKEVIAKRLNEIQAVTA
ncbi:4-hydroxy-tetrahydrodipicolinate synthase [Fulvivirga sediminis]|uniref:4-hydroxy-tetrahydrodipicolinate synthase n=1 Tax=Fulvivirga sediminis TaxID=2803949 RepID=A0A937F547_9BACT|nr:4-hydroxy-tetrahydrodipicolinate synthase [Fulvivirga sediminis]MBL3655940.1 4-hydroxy-tetrahydrodipicolinate synthase [Fulvivirga sediminis]